MRLKLLLLLLFTFYVFSGYGQKKELQSITRHELKAHLEFMASDYMQGRDFGTSIPGLEITAEYLKSECKKMGLTSENKGFSQPVKMISIKSDKEKTWFRLKNKNGETVFKSNDIETFPGSAQNDTIAGNLVFAGYGYHNNNTDYNDFEGIELKDKIVLIMTRNREMALHESEDENYTRVEMSKLARLFTSGARAVIFVTDPENADNSWFEMVKDYASQGRWTIEDKEKLNMSSSNIILANHEIANAILGEKGLTIQEIQAEINKTGKPNSFELKNVTTEIVLSKKAETITGENVIGILEGSDAVLKNECIVISAHYDHVGVNSNGEINNGADDNASGTSALLEIAEAFSLMKKKPRRSIVFAWVTAEEKGLIGSEYYTLHPVFPLEKTIANINLDMVGQTAANEPTNLTNPERTLMGPNGVHIISGNQSSELINISTDLCQKLDLIPFDDMTTEYLPGSDHFSFYKQGIPIIGISTGLHEDYHYPSDDMEKIDYQKMKRVTDYAFLLAYKIANQKNRIVVDNPKRPN
jgi:hypothetical protein